MSSTLQDPSTTCVPIEQAAVHLSMSTSSLRKRLQRGDPRGRKVDGRWTVCLDPDSGPGPDGTPPGPGLDVSTPSTAAWLDLAERYAQASAAAAMWQARAHELQTRLDQLTAGDRPPAEPTTGSFVRWIRQALGIEKR